MTKIFVTGSKGFVAGHLIPKLELLGYDVVTDIRYLHTEQYKAVIHLAAKTSISCDFDADLIESNIVFTKEVFKVNSRIIFASSCSAAHLTNPYAYTKRFGEKLCEIHGNAIALRFHNIYGEGASRGIIFFLMKQEDGATIKVRGPEIIRDYIHVFDIVKTIVAQISPRPIYIDMESLREAAAEVNQRAEDLVKLALEQNIFFGKRDYVDGKKQSGVMDVGTGTALQTMDVVNLYQRLSGKKFIIDVEEAGDNEPKEMVSNFAVFNSISLEDGLTKMINNK